MGPVILGDFMVILMEFYGDFNGINGIYPLVNVYIAIENGPVEIVDLPINSMVIFPLVFCMFTRG